MNSLQRIMFQMAEKHYYDSRRFSKKSLREWVEVIETIIHMDDPLPCIIQNINYYEWK